MDPVLPPVLLASVVAAAAAAVICRAWRISAERELRAREEAADLERKALVLEEQALRRQLHEASESLRVRAESLQEVLRASIELKAHLPLDAVLANVARAASTSFGFRRVLLSLHDRADGVLVPRAHVGLSDEWPRLERLRLPSERLAGVPEGGGPQHPSPLAEVLGDADREGFLSVPLVAADHFVGLLELAGLPSGHPEGAADRVVLELFASQALNAIRLARAHETTRLGSLRDPLTGVANHGHFQETLSREITRHGRSGGKLVLLMADLDDFKAVNDRYGHRAGDAVLKALVVRLLASVREMDTVARYGGEEFAIVLPETDAVEGLRVAERLRAAVAASPVRAGLPEPLRITVSIGLAVHPDDATGKGGLVECADRALYAAKRTGKNRVVRFAKVPVSAEALLTERT